MKKIGIFYGSTAGATAKVAAMIASRLGVAEQDIHNVAHTAPSAVADYDVIVLGASTQGAGDLQEDMDTFLDGVSSLDLSSKMVAIFGLGDEQMANSFCNSVGEIYKRLHDTHAMFFAPFDNDGYDYKHSDSDVKGMIVGLCIDNVNKPEATESRVDAWCKIIKEEIA